jgi:hypothetical protein
VKDRVILPRDYSKIITWKWTALDIQTPPCMSARHTVRLAACPHDHQGVLSTDSSQAQPQQQVQSEEAMLPLRTCGFLSTTIAHEDI